VTIINLNFSILEMCWFMDSVCCGTEGGSGFDKFESRMEKHVKWRMLSGYWWQM